MDKETFKLNLKIADQKYPDIESEYRALGAVDATEFSKELVDLLSTISAYGLWYAAKEAQAVQNEPMLNLIALAALNSASMHNERMIYEDLQTSSNVDRSVRADNYQKAAEKYRIVYDEIIESTINDNKHAVEAQ